MGSLAKVGVGVLLVALVAGCFGPTPAPVINSPPAEEIQPVLGLLAPFKFDSPAGGIEGEAAAGAISHVKIGAKKEVVVELPRNVYLYRNDSFVPAWKPKVRPGEELRFLVPPGMTEVPLKIDGNEVKIPAPDTRAGLFRGENAVEEMKLLRDQYLRRCNACPNYAKSQVHFAERFRSYGMAQVEVDPFGTNALHPDFANVVAYRYPKTDTDHFRWIGFGGHYDTRPETNEGAIDNTAGVVLTLELARVLGNLTPYNNLVFGLWGGEETGTKGSALFVRTNPTIAAQMETYINLDVSGASWPGPQPVARDGTTPDCSQRPERRADSPFFCPDPIIVTAGPDGPLATQLLDLAKRVQQKIVVGYPDAYFVYEPEVVGGQVGGMGRVNAQSDHSQFIAAGVPSFFLFNGQVLGGPIRIHSEQDTLANWTKYMVHNFLLDKDEPITPQEVEQGEALLARSFETYLWLAFYVALEVDLGLARIGV